MGERMPRFSERERDIYEGGLKAVQAISPDVEELAPDVVMGMLVWESCGRPHLAGEGHSRSRIEWRLGQRHCVLQARGNVGGQGPSTAKWSPQRQGQRCTETTHERTRPARGV